MIRRLSLLALAAMIPVLVSAGVIKGKVTCDGKGIAGVQVSDGAKITVTDSKGRYSISSDKADSMVFITTPSGYRAKMIDALRPGFWQMLSKGPKQGETHDFVLEKEDQSRYKVILISDCHLVNEKKRNDLAQFRKELLPAICREAEKESGKSTVYTVNLGDFTQDTYWYTNDFNETAGEKFLLDCGYPTPVYSITGNHDNDPSVANLPEEENDMRSAWIYRRTWGPSCYSVNIGQDHWIFMDGVVYVNSGSPRPDVKGVKGQRNFKLLYAPKYLEWLKEDLKHADRKQRIILCTHSPLLYSSKGKAKDNEQMAQIDEIFSAFDRVTVLSGHTHIMNYTEKGRYDRFRQYVVSATSGNMWKRTKGMKNVGYDGCDQSFAVLDLTQDEPKLNTVSVYGREHGIRIYDMNGVQQYYAADEKCNIYHRLYPKYEWYGAEKFRNTLLVNYWAMQRGETLEVIENGRAVEVKHVYEFDPVAELTYVIPGLKQTSKAKKKKAINYCHNMYLAALSSPDSEVTVNVRDEKGNLIYTEQVMRPKKFDPADPM